MFRVNDRVKIDYIYDNCKYNGKIGTISWLHDYKYYPTKDPKDMVIRTQGVITYDDGYKLNISDMYRHTSGVVSAIKKVG